MLECTLSLQSKGAELIKHLDNSYKFGAQGVITVRRSSYLPQPGGLRRLGPILPPYPLVDGPGDVWHLSADQ